MTTLSIRIPRPDDASLMPSRGSAFAAGLDLREAISLHMEPGERRAIPTGVQVAIPTHHAGLIWPRSGLAVKWGVDVLAGCLDSDFRGEAGVVLINHGKDPVRIDRGDRIAQLLVQPVVMAEPILMDELPESVRGAGGFGSTGK